MELFNEVRPHARHQHNECPPQNSLFLQPNLASFLSDVVPIISEPTMNIVHIFLCLRHGSTRNGTTTLWIGSLFSKNSNLFFSVKLCQPNDVIKSLIFYLVLRKRQLTVKRQKWFALIAYELKVLLQQEVKFTNSYPSVFSIRK